VDQFLACVISNLSVRQEVVTLRRDISRQLTEIRTIIASNSDGGVWKANDELKVSLITLVSLNNCII
jgi:hypothetical protein